jgi:hypothetical protein
MPAVLGKLIAHRPIPAQALAEHACEGRHAGIDVVVYPNLVFVGVSPVQSSGILLERAAPGDRAREKERVEPRIIEPFSDESPGCEHNAAIGIA